MSEAPMLQIKVFMFSAQAHGLVAVFALCILTLAFLFFLARRRP